MHLTKQCSGDKDKYSIESSSSHNSRGLLCGAYASRPSADHYASQANPRNVTLAKSAHPTPKSGGTQNQPASTSSHNLRVALIHFLIDTSILRNDPRREKAAFRAVTRALRGENILLHIPELVIQEFLSQELEPYQKALTDILAPTNRLLKKPLPKFLHNIFTNLKSSCSKGDTLEQIQEIIRDNFNEWLGSVKHQRYPIKPDHSRIVFERYFRGDLPFREPKNREDIPDAFICVTIEDVLKEIDSLHLVVSDKGIQRTFSEKPNITIWPSLDKFVSSEEFSTLLREHYAHTNFTQLCKLFISERHLLEKTIERDILDSLLYVEVVSDAIPGENGKGMITSVDELQETEFRIEDITYYGDGIGVIPFKIELICGIDFSIFKSDYTIMSDKESEGISVSELNEHFFEANKEFTLYVSGNLSIETSINVLEQEDPSEQDLTETAESNSVRIDEINEIDIPIRYEY